MEIDLKQLENTDTLDSFLDLVEPAEKRAFLACYEAKGYTKEAREWWEDICERALPSLPKPRPPAKDATYYFSKRTGASVRTKMDTWWALLEWYASGFEYENKEFWRYKNKKRANEICKELGEIPPNRKCLLQCNRNIEEKNIFITPALRLGIIGYLYFVNEAVSKYPIHDAELTALEQITERYDDTQKIKIARIHERLLVIPEGKNKEGLEKNYRILNNTVLECDNDISIVDENDIIESYLTGRHEAHGSNIKITFHTVTIEKLKEIVALQQTLLKIPLTYDRLGIKTVNSDRPDLNRFKTMVEEEFKRYNPF